MLFTLFTTHTHTQLGSCAIVGNADNVIKGKFGREIDEHDFVMRYGVITKPYLDAVGSKAEAVFYKANYNAGPFAPDFQPTRYASRWTDFHPSAHRFFCGSLFSFLVTNMVTNMPFASPRYNMFPKYVPDELDPRKLRGKKPPMV